MADRRRINGPAGATFAPVPKEAKTVVKRTRGVDTIRKIYLQTGVTPSASGSAYLELDTGATPGTSGLKLSCAVHGPRALPRSMPFSPHLVLSTHVKYAPFATKTRRGYVRDQSERDLAVHLETALRGTVLAERWPKSGVDVVVTVVEADQDRQSADETQERWGALNVLAGCVTVASAALADAGIDCVDTVAGGVAALTRDGRLVVDPVAAEQTQFEKDEIVAGCCVAYLPQRDEVTNVWLKGNLPEEEGGEEEEETKGKEPLHLQLLNKAVHAARQADQVLVAALKETELSGQ